MSLLIPRILHHAWFGGSALPAEFASLREAWRRQHPDWEMVLWTETTLPSLTNQAFFDAASSAAQKKDIASYELLLAHGGVFLDVDVECVRNIEPLLDEVDAFIGKEDARFLCNAIIGAARRHPWVQALVDRIPRQVADHPGTGPNVQTGPSLVTEATAEQMDRGGAVPTIFPPAVFYPYHFTEPHRRGESFPAAYAVHHWSGSWR